jgi:hypothetical protein
MQTASKLPRNSISHHKRRPDFKTLAEVARYMAKFGGSFPERAQPTTEDDHRGISAFAKATADKKALLRRRRATKP